MEKSIFRYILRYSAPQQAYLLAVIVLYYPFLYLSLELPKIIVNRAIEDPSGPPYRVPIFGLEIAADMDQVPFLLTLSFVYLFLVLCNGAFKYHINVYKGRMGERLLRRLRYQLYSRILRFPLPRFRKLSQGELIPIITAEVEPLGGFIGTAFADPLFFGGQLVIILAFIIIQDPMLGAATVAFYPVQMYVIPRLQRRVNELGKRRVRNVRRLAEHIAESVSGIVEVHAHDAAGLERQRFARRLGRIYGIRYEIYRRKFFIKFLNNFIDKLTPFFFFSIGGYLVIVDRLSFGALIAVLAAYKELAAPWKELLLWYQQKEDVRIKYEQVIEQFDPPGMLPEALQRPDLDPGPPLDGDIAVVNLSYSDEDGARLLEGVSFTLPVRCHAAIVGEAGSGKCELAMLIARLIRPTRGRITIGGRDVQELSEAVTGRRIAYVGPHAYLHNASLRENLLYGLVRARPVAGDGTVPGAAPEGEDAGGLLPPLDAGSIDLEAAGVEDAEGLETRILAVLRLVELEQDVYRMGLRGTIDPDARPEVAARVLEARRALAARLADPEIASLVEPFDRDRYNRNATVAENLLFGVPVAGGFDEEHLAEHPYVRSVLDRVGLTDAFVAAGLKIAETMLELFADLPPDHAFFEQYSFISAEDLPDYEQIALRARKGIGTLEAEERLRLLALPFRVVVERHRLGVIDEEMQARILEARRVFAAGLPAALAGAVAFFERDAYCAPASLQDNILFGRLAYGHAHAESRIGELISEVVGTLGLTRTVIDVGLAFSVGVGGARLSHQQRQKLALARAVLKRPDLMILDEATEAMDMGGQERIMEGLRREFEGRGLIWVLNRVAAARHFDHILVLRDGRLVERGAFEELCAQGEALNALLAVA